MWQINKVLISDDIADVCPNVLKQNGIEVVMKTKMKKDELIKELSVCIQLFIINKHTG